MNAHAESWRTVRTDDVEIEFTERGEGDAVFLVHAGVFSDWFRFVARSASLDGLHVVRPRRAGYGAFRPTRHLTLDDHARHVAGLAEHLGVKGLHWVGHSSSCQIGLALALQRPDLVRSLILLEPSAGSRGFDVPASYDRPDFVGPALAAFAAGDLAAAFDTFMRGVCGDGYRTALESRLGKAGTEAAILESAFFFRDEIRAIMEWHFGPDEASHIHQPVLCLEGADQPPHLALMSRQISERTRALLPQADIELIPGVNHALPLQDPEMVAASIGSFIRRVGRSVEHVAVATPAGTAGAAFASSSRNAAARQQPDGHGDRRGGTGAP